MFIQEAIRATTKHQPCITREAWVRLSKSVAGGIKIYPTNSPDCCIIISDAKSYRQRGWQPIAEDLLADDWITVVF